MKMKYLSAIAALTTVILSSVVFSEQPSAQAVSEQSSSRTVLEEIIVTALKREQSIQDVPVSVTALDDETLKKKGLEALRDYIVHVPGAVYAGAPFGERSGPDVAIRGVSNNRLLGSDANIATVTTGFVVGEIPIVPVDPRVLDVDRVEVLKGPQGTLYGAASLGGTLKIVPKKPDPDAFALSTTGDISSTHEGGSNFTGNVVLNVPLIENILAFRFTGLYERKSGFIDLKILQGLPGEQKGGSNPQVTLFPVSQGEVILGTDNSDLLSNVNTEHTTGGRIALRYTPNDRFDATASMFFQDNTQGSVGSAEPSIAFSGVAQSKRISEKFQTEPVSQNFNLVSLEWSYDFGSTTLTSATGFYKREYASSLEWSGFTALLARGDKFDRATDVIPGPSSFAFSSLTEMFSQELRLNGNVDVGKRALSSVDWTVGFFYQNEDETTSGLWADSLYSQLNTNLPDPSYAIPNDLGLLWGAEAKSTYENISVFGDVTFNITDQFSVAGGFRWFKQEYIETRHDVGILSFSGSHDLSMPLTQVRPVLEDGFTYRANMSWKPTDDLMTYFAWSEGFRLGGNNGATTSDCAVILAANNINLAADGQYDSDALESFELGVKMSLQRSRATLNLALYRNVWSDLQQTVVGNALNPPAGQSNNCTGVFTVNAGEAEITGFEVEYRTLWGENFEFSATGAYTDAAITKEAPGGTAVVGERLPNAPELTLSLGAQYNFPILSNADAYVRADFSFVDKRNINPPGTPAHGLILSSYEILNLKLGFEIDKWRFVVYADNVLDEFAEFGASTREGGAGTWNSIAAPGVALGTQRFVSTSRPRTIGISVGREF